MNDSFWKYTTNGNRIINKSKSHPQELNSGDGDKYEQK